MADDRIKLGKRLLMPAGHEVGMRVPTGGSSCAKCAYVSADGKHCGQEDFQAWNKGDTLPAPAAAYCCDFFEPATRYKTLSGTLTAQREKK